MKTSKDELAAQVRTLEKQLAVRDYYLSAAFRSAVTHITKGSIKLSICGEASANGGVVLESQRCENSGKWVVITVAYWEEWYQKARQYPARSDDKDMQDRRTCADAVARHVADMQEKAFQTV